MQRMRKLQLVLAILMLLLGLTSFNIKNVSAWYNTPIQTATYEDDAKIGTTTQYGYIGPAAERDPQFYSALIVKGIYTLGGIYYPNRIKIEVTGTAPDGSPLAGDSFGDLSVLVSPDDSGVEREILRTIYDILVDVLPYGLDAVVKNTQTEGGATTGRDVEKAWGQWQLPLGQEPGWNKEKGFRFGYELNVDPTLEGTYTINIHYYSEIWCYIDVVSILVHTFHLYDTVYYEYVNTPPAPSTPSGYTSGYVGVSYSYSTSTTDPNGDSLRYQFYWGDGSYTTTGWYTSGATASASHSWSSTGYKYVKVRAQDSTGAWSGWSPYLTVTISPSPPPTYTLTISASTGGTTNPAPGTYTYDYGSSVTVKASAFDPYYVFDYWRLDGATVYANPITVTMDSDHTLKAYFEYTGWVAPPCPTLFVWNGNDYVDYGVIDIHNPSGEDVVREVSIAKQDLAVEDSKVKIRLQEGWEGLEFSESVIDQVELYAINEDGKQKRCPLLNAEHSRLGDVQELIVSSDDVKAQILLLETIGLTFKVPEDVQGFTFVIEGCNIIKWDP